MEIFHKVSASYGLLFEKEALTKQTIKLTEKDYHLIRAAGKKVRMIMGQYAEHMWLDELWKFAGLYKQERMDSLLMQRYKWNASNVVWNNQIYETMPRWR